MRVAFTRYPRGEPEVTVWAEMPMAPRVGDTVHLSDESIPAMRVTHVSWVQEAVNIGITTVLVWHAECSVVS